MSSREPERERGPDPSFPWLGEDDWFPFPGLRKASPDGFLCSGGNLSPGMLLSAYRQGIFPWYDDDSPILWWSPNPRFVLFPDELHVSGTMKKLIRKRRFALTADKAFPEVIRNCSKAPRHGQRGTWITDDMVEAYERLHALGLAHSAEAWSGDRLAGGLYGVALGGIFFGESMFSLEDDASKAAFIPLVWRLMDSGFALVDSQLHTPHVEGLGGRPVPRDEFLALLHAALRLPGLRGSWSTAWPDYPSSSRFDALTEARIR